MNYHFGLLCPPLTGHLNPMLSLALELKQKGHRVTLFHYKISKDLSQINNLGIETVSVCTEANQLLFKELQTLGKLVGWKANDQTSLIYKKLAEINLHYLPEKIKSAQCNFLLVDQTLSEGETISYCVQLPFINICNALMLNPNLNLPPALIGWQPNFSKIGLLRNYIGYLYIGLRLGSSLVHKYRKQNQLPSYPSIFNKTYFDNLWSKVATITQQPANFEFPRSDLAENFYFTGPFINPEIREKIEFPWEKLNGKPIIYASLGTLQNSLSDIFEKIAQACMGIDYQLVMSLGKKKANQTQVSIDKMPKDVIVVDYAPQLELLEEARLCITHAGINTTLESLSNGVPMVAIPIANDQPGVSARIEWTKTGKVLKYNCTKNQIKRAIDEVLNNDVYRQNALKMQQEIYSSDGLKRAADIIEQAAFKLAHA